MIGITIAVVAVASDQIRTWPDYIPGHKWKSITLTAPGYFVGLVLAWGIWLVRDGLRQLGQQPLSTESARTTALKTFLICKDDLNRFLGTLGAILGLLVLSTAAHRQMVLSYVTYSAYHKQPDKTRKDHSSPRRLRLPTRARVRTRFHALDRRYLPTNALDPHSCRGSHP
jgi:hypothetical protein